jgi:hypothetical protein
MRSSWESDDEAERAATASACPPAPPRARAPRVDGRASVVCAPFKFIFLHSLCCGGDTGAGQFPIVFGYSFLSDTYPDVS